MRPDPVVVALREKIEELEETIRQLRTRSKDIPVWPGLWRTECVLLGAMTARAGLCSYDYLVGCLKVAIYRLRKKLPRLDPEIVIRTMRCEGYWMDADSRARVAIRHLGKKDQPRNDGSSAPLPPSYS